MSREAKFSSLVWFRRDLRIDDQAALAAASAQGGLIYGCFVFERTLLDALDDNDDRRVHFMRAALAALNRAWQDLAAARQGESAKSGIGLIFLEGDPVQLIPSLAERLGVGKVFASRDYEPAAKRRDDAVASRLQGAGRELVLVKDQVIFESDQVLTGAGRPFSVFTPYCKAWRKRLGPEDLMPHPLANRSFELGEPPRLAEALSCAEDGAPRLESIGFVASTLPDAVSSGWPGGMATLARFAERIDHYHAQRDFPALDATSRLSVHLRFGTVSIRSLARMAWQRENLSGSAGAATWLNELIWREFYMAVLDLCPQVVDGCWRPEYNAVKWNDDPAWFTAWCAGMTGYPFVDAAMRELVGSGFMHNRARMVVASFLTKDLGIDWRLGERYFARYLLDYDLAANNGGWQWAASTGCDAQPYFRIFNPVTQSERFDPTGEYIRKWVPELARTPLRYLHAPWKMSPIEQAAANLRLGVDYPSPLVDHAVARDRTLARYAAARNRG